MLSVLLYLVNRNLIWVFWTRMSTDNLKFPLFNILADTQLFSPRAIIFLLALFVFYVNFSITWFLGFLCIKIFIFINVSRRSCFMILIKRSELFRSLNWVSLYTFEAEYSDLFLGKLWSKDAKIIFGNMKDWFFKLFVLLLRFTLEDENYELR